MANDSRSRNNDPEKRRKDRVHLPRKQVLGELHLDATGQKHEVEVYLNDLSPSGVGILIESPLDPGSTIHLHLKQPKHLTLRGEVVWCSQFSVHGAANDDQKDTFAFKAGIKFTPPQPEVLQILKQYTDKQTKKRKQ